MSFPPAQQLLTAEDLYDIPDDDRRYELVKGVLVVSEPPGFTHGDIAGQIYSLLRAYSRPRKLGKVVGEVGYVLARTPDTVRGPDVSLVRSDRVPTGPAADKFVEGAPDIAVEIRSPGDRAGEVAEKVAEYLATGTALVWVVEPRRRLVIVHTPDGVTRVLRDGETVDGGTVLPGFTAPVSEFLPDL
ncbi:MAG TPA: Uma2 family endonuclease [Gemmatirosa sp.]